MDFKDKTIQEDLFGEEWIRKVINVVNESEMPEDETEDEAIIDGGD